MTKPAAEFDINATDRTKKAFSSVTSRLKTLSVDAAKTIASVSAVTATAATGLAISSARNAKEMTAYANSIGMSTEQLSAWGYAADTVSVSQEKLNDVFRDTSDKIGDAFVSGGGAALDVLERLNLNAADMVKLAPDEQLLKIAEGLDQVGTQSEKVFLLEALASDASMLLPLLDNNAEKLKELKNEAIASGAALGDMDAAKIKEANDAWDQSLAIIQGVGNKLAVELSPFVAEVAGRFKDAAIESNGFSEEVKQAMSNVMMSVAYTLDVIRGLEVVIVGLKALFQGFAAGMYEGIDELQKMIVSVVNLLPTVDIKPIELLSTITKEANKDFSETSKILSELVQKPMPSTEAKKFIAEVTAAAEEAAVKITAVKEKASYTTIAGFDPITQQQEQAAEKLMVLEDSLMSETQRLQQAHENRQFIVEDAFQNQLITEQKKNALIEQLDSQHQASRNKIAKSAMQERLNVTKGIFGNLSTLMSSSSKKEFEVGKKAAVATALIKGYEAITSSYAAGAKVGGPWVGAAYAATAALATRQQIKNIRSQSFNGGGGGVSVSGGAGGGVSTGSNFNGGAPAQAVPASSQTQQQTSSGATTVIQLVGQDKTFTSDQVDDLFGQIGEALERGDKVLFSSNSRQALELSA